MRLNEIFAQYKDDVEFMCIYIREAHSDDGWRVQDNLDQNIIYNEPTTDDERTEVAAACQIAMDLKMPYYIDGIDNDVENKYLSLPMRLYLVAADGKIAYTGERGPFGFNMDTWVEAIEGQLGG